MTASGPGAWASEVLHTGFLAQEAAAPDAEAVITTSARLTYADVGRAARALAAALRAAGVAHGDRVGVVMDKGWEQVVAVLATSMTGTAYVPLDPTSPPARLLDVLDRTDARVVLTQDHLLDGPALASTGRPLLVVGDDARLEASATDMDGGAGEPADVRPDDLAYVIFTSGSTGAPKGVMISHGAASNTIRDINDRFAVGPRDRVIALSSLSFDLSVYDVFGTLAAGGAVVIPDPDRSRDPAHWSELVRGEGVTVWNSVPALMQMAADYADGDPSRLGPSLRLVMLSGDWIPVKLPDAIRDMVPGARVVSLGGATEGSIWSIAYEIQARTSDWASIPYGKALRNQSMHVLRDDMSPAAIGEAGDIYIGGVGVALGYWGDDAQTAASFVRDPVTDERLYRTGDRGRLLPDGNIEFLGRQDAQVKINGFRVELGEVEAGLAAHPGVAQAAVIAVGPSRGERRLVGFVIPVAGHAIDGDAVAGAAADLLPDYMVPSAVVVLDAMPLTANGKVDAKALAAKYAADGADIAAEDAPQGPFEEQVAAVWAEVLELPAIGRHDNVLDLGASSLAITQALARLRSVVDPEVPISLIWRHPTTAALAAALAAEGYRLVEAGAPPADAAPPPASRPVVFPLSFGQHQVWFLDKVAGGNRAYQFQCAIRLCGTLHVDVLQRALTELVRRHEILRTTFEEVDGVPSQVVHPAPAVDLPVIDLTALPVDEREAAAQERIAREVAVAFDVGRLPLIRWTVIRMSADEHILLDVEHHFIHDGWSVAVMYRELEALYRAFLRDEPSPLPELTMQFGDYAVWQRQTYTGRHRENLLAYWTGQLQGAHGPALPLRGRRSRTQTFSGDAFRVRLPIELYRAARQFSRAHGVSLFVTMLTAFAATLQRIAGEDDITIGSWFGNRQTRDTEQLIGMLVNSVLLRVDWGRDTSFADAAQQAYRVVLGAHAHQEAPFDDVVRALGITPDLSRNPVTQVFFSFHDSPVPEFDWPDASGRLTELGNATAKFDLNIIVFPQAEQRRRAEIDETRDELSMLWEFNTELFEPGFVRRLAECFTALLEDAVSQPDTPVGRLRMMSEAERARVVALGEGPRRPLPAPASVFELFWQAAASAPNRTAVVDESGSYTYADVARLAQAAAGVLANHGLDADNVVALHLRRSVELAAFVLGSLHAGCPFVPLDPDFPPDRLRYTLEHSHARLAVTAASSDANRSFLSVDAAPCVAVDARTGEGFDLDAPLPDRELLDAPGGRTAYVLYTSGSTGWPKGVVVPETALVNLLLSMQQTPGFTADDVLMSVTTPSFDIFYLELLLPLITGGTVVLADRRTTMEGAALAAAIDRHAATVLQATPATWRLLLAAGWKGRAGLRALVGGEPFPPDLAAELLPLVEDVWNVYGPTETTIWSTQWQVTSAEDVAIGTPIANTNVYVLDPDEQLQPLGGRGELCIGGLGVAAGYMNDPEQTHRRFVRNPVVQNGVVYRTGDMVRMDERGVLVFEGRADRQVKVRGYRVELEEIERVLANHPGVKQVVVLPDQSGEQLVAFVVPVTDDLHAETLREAARHRLPEYMVPSQYRLIDDVPLTPNGKVDAARLAEMAPRPLAPGSLEGRPPQTPTEHLVAEAWAGVLGLSEVHADTSFFALGGHSLAALRLVSRLRVEHGIEVPIQVVFDYPTVEEMAYVIDATS